VRHMRDDGSENWQIYKPRLWVEASVVSRSVYDA